jgi:hypothetical protein
MLYERNKPNRIFREIGSEGTRANELLRCGSPQSLGGTSNLNWSFIQGHITNTSELRLLLDSPAPGTHSESQRRSVYQILLNTK